MRYVRSICSESIDSELMPGAGAAPSAVIVGRVGTVGVLAATVTVCSEGASVPS